MLLNYVFRQFHSRHFHRRNSTDVLPILPQRSEDCRCHTRRRCVRAGIDRDKYVYDSSDLYKGGENGDRFYDFRKLPYADASYSVALLDVPWGCHKFYTHAQEYDRAYEGRYGNVDRDDKHDGNVGRWGGDEHKLTPAYVWSLYTGGMRECVRILEESGILVVKCQDKMVGQKQRRYEIEVWHYAVDELGLTDVAKYLLYYPGHRPRNKTQINPRNCVSCFWVFRKGGLGRKHKARLDQESETVTMVDQQ